MRRRAGANRAASRRQGSTRRNSRSASTTAQTCLHPRFESAMAGHVQEAPMLSLVRARVTRYGRLPAIVASMRKRPLRNSTSPSVRALGPTQGCNSSDRDFVTSFRSGEIYIVRVEERRRTRRKERTDSRWIATIRSCTLRSQIPSLFPERFGLFSLYPSGIQANRIVDLWESWREGQHHEVIGTAFRHRSKTGDGKSALTSLV
jgi:hypothetical protein